ncbi:MAG: ComEC/Rec2 family competence protein, partial [Treponema sp.]|nr:ComEC/Rec2 family competence protein [Treponema sp.]
MSGKRPEIPASMDCLKSISGSVSLNPSKSGSGKTYSTEIALSSVGMVSGGAEFRSEASGKIKVMIPSSIVEAVYPGKLHSVSSSAVLIENGEKISCTGVWSDSIGAFMAESVTYEGYDDSFWGVISHFRAVCRLMFKRLMFSWGHAGGLLLSLLSGAREYLEDGLGDSFRHAGLSHVLALSGMHLSFFSSMAGGVGKTI